MEYGRKQQSFRDDNGRIKEHMAALTPHVIKWLRALALDAGQITQGAATRALVVSPSKRGRHRQAVVCQKA